MEGLIIAVILIFAYFAMWTITFPLTAIALYIAYRRRRTQKQKEANRMEKELIDICYCELSDAFYDLKKYIDAHDMVYSSVYDYDVVYPRVYDYDEVCFLSIDDYESAFRFKKIKLEEVIQKSTTDSNYKFALDNFRNDQKEIIHNITASIHSSNIKKLKAWNEVIHIVYKDKQIYI